MNPTRLSTLLAHADCPARAAALHEAPMVPRASDVIGRLATEFLAMPRSQAERMSADIGTVFYDKASGCASPAHIVARAKGMANEIRLALDVDALDRHEPHIVIEGSVFDADAVARWEPALTVVLVSLRRWRSSLEMQAHFCDTERPVSWVREYLMDVSAGTRIVDMRQWNHAHADTRELRQLVNARYPAYENNQSRNCGYGLCPRYGTTCRSHMKELS